MSQYFDYINEAVIYMHIKLLNIYMRSNSMHACFIHAGNWVYTVVDLHARKNILVET